MLERPAQPVVRRHGHREWLLVQLVGLEAVERHRECQDSDIDFSRMQFLEHHVGLILVQHELEPRQLLAQLAGHVRQ